MAVVLTQSRRQEPASPPSLLVVVNGNASGIERRAAGLLDLLRATGSEVDLVRTTTLADFARVWGDADGRRLVLVGGDGTVHAAVNLPGPPRDLALIPAGRANNIARSLGIPLDWERAARLAVHGDVRAVDLIEARSPDRRLLVVEGLSVGFLAHARVRYHGRNSADVLAGCAPARPPSLASTRLACVSRARGAPRRSTCRSSSSRTFRSTSSA